MELNYYITKIFVPKRRINDVSHPSRIVEGSSLWTFLENPEWVDVSWRVRKQPTLSKKLEDRYQMKKMVADRISVEFENFDGYMNRYLFPIINNYLGRIDPYGYLSHAHTSGHISLDEVTTMYNLLSNDYFDEYTLLKCVDNNSGAVKYLGAIDNRFNISISPYKTVQVDFYDFATKYLQRRQGMIGFVPYELQNMQNRNVAMNRYGTGYYYSSWIRGVQTYYSPFFDETMLLIVVALPSAQGIDSNWINRDLDLENIYMYIPSRGYEKVKWIGNAPLNSISLDIDTYDEIGRRTGEQLRGRVYDFYEVWFSPIENSINYVGKFPQFGIVGHSPKPYPFPYESGYLNVESAVKQVWESNKSRFSFIFELPTISNIIYQIYEYLRSNEVDPIPELVKNIIFSIGTVEGLFGWKTPSDRIFVNWDQDTKIYKIVENLAKYTDMRVYGIPYENYIKYYFAHLDYTSTDWNLTSDIVDIRLNGEISSYGNKKNDEDLNLGTDAELKDDEKIDYNEYMLAKYKQNYIRYKMIVPLVKNYKNIKIGDRIYIDGDYCGIVVSVESQPNSNGIYDKYRIETERREGDNGE